MLREPVQLLHSGPGKNYIQISGERVEEETQQRIFEGICCVLRRLGSHLHGTSVAMYIVGQERRLVNPPSQVVAGVRTVTTNMNGRDVLPRLSRPFALHFHLSAFCLKHN